MNMYLIKRNRKSKVDCRLSPQMRILPVKLILLSFILLTSCQSAESQQTTSEGKSKSNFKPRHQYDFENNGRDTTGKKFTKTYELRPIDTLPVLSPSEDLTRALSYQLKYINRKRQSKTHRVDKSLRVSNAQLKKTIQAVQNWKASPGQPLSDFVKGYQICGDDNYGNAHITGYFVPVLKVRSKPDAEYKYPLYRKPRSASLYRASRKRIDTDGILKGKGLELAWSSSLLDNFFMQVQGSGVVEYEDGRQVLLSYAGQNGKRYKSIGKRLVDRKQVAPDKISLDAIRAWVAQHPDSLETLLNSNPSYVYFNKSNKLPTGAASVPLTALTSVAVDKRYMPLGSCLLAAVPVLDSEGEFLRHEYRIVVAQDVGGAIKGVGRMDFYCGVGEEGQRRASALKHYGKVWLLVAK